MQCHKCQGELLPCATADLFRCPNCQSFVFIKLTMSASTIAPGFSPSLEDRCPMCQAPITFFNGLLKGCLNGHTFANPACFAPNILHLDPETEASPPLLSLWTEPIEEELTYCVAKDSLDMIETAIVPSREEAWDYATQLLLKNKRGILQVIFYDVNFLFVNALRRTGHPAQVEVITEQEKQALLAQQKKKRKK